MTTYYNVPGVFTTSGSIKQFTVTTSGTYDILVQGGHGAKGNSGVLGGKGAYEEARFWLTAGTKLDFVVGHYGYGRWYGGGGASIVWIDQGSFSSLPANPLIEAGGGGGSNFESQVGGNATFTSGLGADNASAAQMGGYRGAFATGATGGSGGAGGTTNYSGGGGSGWASIGSDGFGKYSGIGGEHFSGGSGYINASKSGEYGGGYGGGGGGGSSGGGGGGGFNGGGGGSVDPLRTGSGAGGGGGSYISSGYSSVFVSAGPQMTTSLNTSIGFVSISLYSLTCYLPVSVCGTHIDS